MDRAECASRVRHGCGLFELPSRGVIEVRGEDRERWLNGMVTNEVRGLTTDPSSARYATVLTARGIILADLWIFARSDRFWLEAAAPHITDLIAHLRKFIIADDVQLEDISEQLVRCSVEGPKSFALLSAALGEELALGSGEVREIEIAGTPMQILGASSSGERAAQLFLPRAGAQPVLDRLREAGAAFELVEGDAACLEILRVEAGIPAREAELLPDVFPHEARLQRAISTRKGCYIGQEIVARLESRGHVNHLLVGLRLGENAAPPRVEEPIRFEGKVVGEITSSVRSPGLGAIALGYVRSEQAAPGTEVTVAEQRAEVVSLPFITPPNTQD